MQTLKQVKTEMYNNMKDRWNDFLEDEEKYIVDFLKSDPNLSGSISVYNESQAFDIACESLEGYTKTDKEELNWEAGYIRGYEVALNELGIELNSSKDKVIIGSFIHYLLTN